MKDMLVWMTLFQTLGLVIPVFVYAAWIRSEDRRRKVIEQELQSFAPGNSERSERDEDERRAA